MRGFILLLLAIYAIVMLGFFYDQGWLLIDGDFEKLKKSTDIGMWLGIIPFIAVFVSFKVKDFLESKKSNDDNER